jgi:hypothetical protein
MKSHHFAATVSALAFFVFLKPVCAQNVDLPQDYSLDIRLGLSARSHAMGSSMEITGTPANGIGAEVFQNLIANSGYGSQTYPWKLTLVNNSIVNATSNPGGQVYVYGGLMQVIGDNKGLWAAVLSHETAHTGQRHGVKLYLQEEYNERMIEYYRARMRAGDKSPDSRWRHFRSAQLSCLRKWSANRNTKPIKRGC